MTPSSYPSIAIILFIISNTINTSLSFHPSYYYHYSNTHRLRLSSSPQLSSFHPFLSPNKKIRTVGSHRKTTTTTPSSSSSLSSSSTFTIPPFSYNNDGTNNNNDGTTTTITTPSNTPTLTSLTATTNVVGDADRAFQLGLQLEHNGRARAASAAYHEAATLYQCFLDNQNDDDDDDDCGDAKHTNVFGHVTTLRPDGPNGVKAALAYACVRLAHLSHFALGDSKAATRLYKDATLIDPKNSPIPYHGIGTTIEASSPSSLPDAITAYRAALKITPSDPTILFHLAIALERLGAATTNNNTDASDAEATTDEYTLESEAIMDRLRRSESPSSSLVDSWGYVRWHTRRTPPLQLNLHRGSMAMLQKGVDAASSMISNKGGLVCEFGVSAGMSLRMIQELIPLEHPLHGFDTFWGLPYRWGEEPKGAYSTGGTVPDMQGVVYFHRGLFRDTIPLFLESRAKKEGEEEGLLPPLALAHIDCALYTSTLEVLETMHGRVVPGTVFVFDKYLCHPTWRQDEFRAWKECCKRFGWQYKYLAFSLSSKQAVLQIT